MSATGIAIEEGKRTASRLDEKLTGGPGRIGVVVFLAALVVGLGYAGSQLVGDLAEVRMGSMFPYVLLCVALLVALGFEFVNGFHDTANAVATVIYTHSLTPHVAVVWSGMWNFLGEW
jgi:PiT family inorganic phosphate transporter